MIDYDMLWYVVYDIHSWTITQAYMYDYYPSKAYDIMWRWNTGHYWVKYN